MAQKPKHKRKPRVDLTLKMGMALARMGISDETIYKFLKVMRKKYAKELKKNR